jgi:hypothetical protein
MPDDTPLRALPREQLLDALTTMLRIRAFGLKVEVLFKAGKIPGFTHLHLGEEHAFACLTPTALMGGASRASGFTRYLIFKMWPLFFPLGRFVRQRQFNRKYSQLGISERTSFSTSSSF